MGLTIATEKIWPKTTESVWNKQEMLAVVIYSRWSTNKAPSHTPFIVFKALFPIEFNCLGNNQV